jgi:C1A family cysteine protease
MGAMVLFGVPPEEYWPYIIEDFDKEPSSFCYSYAKEYQTIQYFRLDPPATSGRTLLDLIKAFIVAGFPSMFGFTVFNSIRQARNDGKIPFPCRRERVLGGHAIIALGFNDEIEIENQICGAKTTGALLIRNSWGKRWGKEGYGWLPYKYILRGLARDWWLLLRNEWVESGQFGI